MRFNRLGYGLLAAGLCLGVVGTASAQTVLNFDQAGGHSPGGTIAYDGEGGALIGSGISFGVISLNNRSNQNPPQGHDRSVTCEGCQLNFTTGNNIEEANAGRWTFSGGGQLTLTGTVKDSNGTIASGDIIRGTFVNQGGYAPQILLKTRSNSVNVSTHGRDDRVNHDLLDYFGLPTDAAYNFANTEISLDNVVFGGNGSVRGDVSNADLDNIDAPPTRVPEPQELGLFFLGSLMLVAGIVFRRRKTHEG